MNSVESDPEHLVAVAANVVTAYIASNHIQSAELSRLLVDVHATLVGLSQPGEAAPEASRPAKLNPQEIRRSIKHDHIVSFEDGKGYKTLRRHLTLRGLTPESYREKWGLPPEYPMTCASYSEQRSKLAKSFGLGQKRTK